MPTTFSVAEQVKRVRGTLDALGQTQLPFATAKAINATLLEVQRVELASINRAFTVRRPDFAKRSVKIERADFATKKNPVGRIGIQGDRADVYAKFEAGGTKAPRAGQHVAVPITGSLVKRNARSIVPRELRPAQLGQSLTVRVFERRFKKDPSHSGLFAVDRVAEAQAQRLKGQGKRVGKRIASRAVPRLLYALPSTVPITRRLDFVPTARAVVGSAFVPNLRAAVAEALRTARK